MDLDCVTATDIQPLTLQEEEEQALIYLSDIKQALPHPLQISIQN